MEWKVFYDKFIKYKYDNGIITDNDSNNVVELFSIYATRNQTGTTGDNKKSGALYPFVVKYGHANGDITANPNTGTMYGAMIQGTWNRGYCSVVSDLALTGGIVGGTMAIGVKYGIYQTSNFGSNYFSANVGIKNTKPTSSLSVSGTFATTPYNYIDQDVTNPSFSLITMTPNAKDVSVTLPTAKESLGRIYRIARGSDSSYKCNIIPNSKITDTNTKFLWDCQTLTESSASNLPIVLSGDSGLYTPSSERISNSGLKVLKLQFGASAKITNSTNIPLTSMNTFEFYNYVPYFNSLTTKSWLFDMRQNETDIAPWCYVNFVYNVGMQINFGIGTTTYITNYVNTNTWYHVAVYISASTLKLFIDGVCVGISNFATPLVFASVPFIYLGDSPLHIDTQAQAYYMDDIRISSTQRYASNGNTNIPIDKFNMADIIDGESSPLQLYNKGDYVVLQSDGSRWNVLNKKLKSDLESFQTRIDDSLPTASKSVIGAIGEVCLSMTLQGIKPLYETYPFGNSTSATQAQIQSWFDNNAYLINYESYDTINPSTDCNVTLGCDQGYVLWLGNNSWYYSLNNGSGDYWSNMTPMASKGDFTLGKITMIAMGKKFISEKANSVHTHVKTDITNFAHSHVKTDISDLTNATTTVSGLMSNTDKTKLDNIYSLSSSSKDFKTAYSASGIYRLQNPTGNIPTGYTSGNCDFWVDVKYIDASNQNLTAYDIKSSAIWRLSCIAGTWGTWIRLDYGTSASSDKINSPDTRGVSGYSTPSDYMSKGKGIIYEFKNNSDISLSSTTFPVIGAMSYCQVETKIPWSDSSGGYPTQTATCSGYVFTRTGTADTTWGSWTQFITVPSSIDYVIETWRSGTEWRRTYKSGWVEQGGYSVITSDNNVTITLPVTMLDANYSVMTTVKSTNSTSSGSDTSYYGNPTTTGFTLYSDYSGSTYKTGVRWEVRGQKA